MLILKSIILLGFIGLQLATPVVSGEVGNIVDSKMDNKPEPDCIVDTLLKDTPSMLTKEIKQDWINDLFQKGKVSPNYSSLISVTELKKQTDKDNFVVVDVRNADEFEALQIPGSINITERYLLTKTFLKNKKVILVNEGFAISALQSLSERMKKSGFKSIRVLRGGLNAWQHEGEKLEGNVLNQTIINQILPKQFYPELNYSDVVVLDVSSLNGKLARKEISRQLKSRLIKQTGSKRNDRLRIVITSKQGDGYETVRQAIENLNWPYVFYLQGGTQAYMQYMTSMWAMWHRPGKQGKKNICGRRKS